MVNFAHHPAKRRGPHPGGSRLNEGSFPPRFSHRWAPPAMSAVVKGFGCRPVVTYPPVVRAGVRKPPRKEPAGRWRAACRLWGFDSAAVSARAGLGGVVKGG